MAVGDFFRTTTVYSHPQADGDVVNVVDFVQDELVVSQSDAEYCEELAIEVRDTVETEWLPSISDEWSLLRVECHGITNPLAQSTATSTADGEAVEESVSIRSAPVVTKETGVRGRSFRGRMFLTSITEASQAGGVMSAGLISTIQSFVDALRHLTLTNLNQYQMVVYSTLLTDGTKVTSLIVRANLGTIRGRQKVS